MKKTILNTWTKESWIYQASVFQKTVMQLKYNYFGKIEVTDSQNKEAKKINKEPIKCIYYCFDVRRVNFKHDLQ